MTPEYLAAKEKVESFPRKINKRAILFLNNERVPFAGINAAGVWMAVSKHEGKNWYSYMPSEKEKILGIDKLRYSESCDLAKEIANKYLCADK